jgi:3-oxoacyl-[acyl-carrier protein] reductase
MSQVSLDGRVALVTGGSRGIGRAIVQKLADAGAVLAVHSSGQRYDEDSIVKQLENNGKRAMAFYADFSNPTTGIGLVHDVEKALGPIDILVNNAGMTSVVPLDNLTVSDWEKVVSVNLCATFFCSQTAAKSMVSNGNGNIIMVGSTSYLTGGGGGVHYAASKAGLLGLMRALSRELAPCGIRVNLVEPTMIDSDFLQARYPEPLRREGIGKRLPLGRLGKPEEVANAVLYLASQLSSFVTGTELVVDGGRTYCM